MIENSILKWFKNPNETECTEIKCLIKMPCPETRKHIRKFIKDIDPS